MQIKLNKRKLNKVITCIILYIMIIGYSYSNALSIKMSIWKYLRNKMIEADYPSTLYLTNLIFRSSWIDILLTMVLSSFIYINLYLLFKLFKYLRDIE